MCVCVVEMGTHLQAPITLGCAKLLESPEPNREPWVEQEPRVLTPLPNLPLSDPGQGHWPLSKTMESSHSKLCCCPTGAGHSFPAHTGAPHYPVVRTLGAQLQYCGNIFLYPLVCRWVTSVSRGSEVKGWLPVSDCGKSHLSSCSSFPG